jgi:glycosyltransferase involved in cell wall biosynthesis
MAARARWRFGARHVILICGHLSHVKGYPTFLRAAAQIAAALPGCAFVALGGETIQKGFRAELERLAGELGIAPLVHFLGFQDDVPAIVKAADVMALPSRDEGLPLAVLEAMACGRPVVSTPVGGVPEAVIDGETGLLVRPDDSEALAGAVLRILRDNDLASRLGAAARHRVEDGFSLDRFVVRVAALYEELLAAQDHS